MAKSKEAEAGSTVEATGEKALQDLSHLEPYQFKANDERTVQLARRAGLASAEARKVLKGLREEGQAGYWVDLLRIEALALPLWEKAKATLEGGGELTDSQINRLLALSEMSLRHRARLIPAQAEADVRVRVDDAPIPIDPVLRESIVRVATELRERRRLAEQVSERRLGDGTDAESGENEDRTRTPARPAPPR